MRSYLAGTALVFIVSALTASGWLFGIAWLLRIVNDGTLMQMNTAISFLSLSAAIALYRFGDWAAMLSVPAVALGFLTLLEYATGYSLGVDTLFIAHHAMPGITAGRMGENTALCFVLLSTPLYYARGHVIARISIVASLVLSAAGLIGHILGADKLYTWGAPIGIGMAITTGVSFLILGAIEYRDRFNSRTVRI